MTIKRKNNGQWSMKHYTGKIEHYVCHWNCSWRDVLDTTLCNNVSQWLTTGRWFSPVPYIISLRHIYLNLKKNTITQHGAEGPSWSWSYGSWIYNYLCNKCLSPPMFKSRSGRCVQHYVIKFVSDLRQVRGFLLVFWFPPPIKLTATI